MRTEVHLLNGARGLAAGAFALAAMALGTGTAQAAADPVITVGADGKTAPVFSYADAKRERVWVPVAGVDQDANGVTDRVAIDIIRPKESGPNLKVPAIIDDSPYYTSVGRGNETQFIHTTADGVLDKFPLFYDNYFVPRGYAVILAHADRHRVLDRLPAARRPGRRRRLQGRHRLARGPHPRLTRPSTGDTLAVRRLGQRQERDDRQVLRRHVRQRRRRHGRRRPDDDRPDLGDLRSGTTTRAWAASGRTPTTRAAWTTASPAMQSRRPRSACCRPITGRRARTCSTTWTPSTVTTPATSTRSGTTATTPRTSARSRRPSSSRTASTTTTSARTRCAAGGPASPPTTSRASCGCRYEGHVDPFDYRRDRVGRHAAPLVRLLAPGRPERHHGRAARRHRAAADTFTTYADWPDPGHDQRPTSTSAAARAGQSGTLSLSSGGGDRQPRVHRQQPVRDQRDQHARTARRPTGSSFLTTEAQDRPAPLGHADHRPPGLALARRRATWRRCSSTTAPSSHVGRGGSDGVTNTTTHLRCKPCVGDSHRRRQRLLPRGHQARPDRHAVARLQGHPGLLEPRLAVHGQASPVDAGSEVRVQVPGPADGVHVPGRPPARRGPAGQLLDGRRRHHAAPSSPSTRRLSKVILPVTGGVRRRDGAGRLRRRHDGADPRAAPPTSRSTRPT